jgi:hypothetical protein
MIIIYALTILSAIIVLLAALVSNRAIRKHKKGNWPNDFKTNQNN